MTNSVIRICNFVHYIFREGGYLDCDQFSLLLFSLFMVGRGGPKVNSAKFIIYTVFLAGFPKKKGEKDEVVKIKFKVQKVQSIYSKTE